MVKNMKKMNEIKTRDELADFLRIERKTLTYVLYKTHIESYYTSFEIPKKNGGKRKIDAPRGILKMIQKKLSYELYKYKDDFSKENKIKVNISHAFEKRKNIISNAFVHKNKKYIVNFDLENFFDSFHFGRVKGFFMKNKYFEMPLEVATIIAQLTCYNGKLPQGAPTSPIISNLICNVLDYKILALAKKYRLDYTRYADDLTFSTNDKNFLKNYEKFCESLNKIIINNGFKLNTKKTRLIYKDSKQTVTGLVVNKKINIDHEYYKKVRAMANNLYKNNKFYIDGKEGTINNLEGRFSYINEIDKYNNKLNNEIIKVKTFKEFNSREKEFQKFLFFKKFYNNDKPIIVTEGKTDIIYIKSALKKLYKDYPELIEKDSEGNFRYKIDFLKRSKRLRYFFYISIDGADAMNKLYMFFNESNNKECPNYLKYFNKLTGNKPKNPVILIFDNEIKNSEKPLKKFIKNNHISNKKIYNGGYEKIDNESNVFLVTHQLVKNKDECEIEDLFKDEVLNHKINGKEFTRDSKFDIEKFYGKDHFSKYISSSYEKIDFSDFKFLLNQIKEIVIKNKH